MKMRTHYIQLMAVIILAFSCDKKASGEDDSGSSTDKVVKGKVTDTQGRPIKGATILIDNTLIYNSYLTGSTGDDGTYRIKLFTGSWQAYAEMNVTYQGKTYKIDLHPDNAQGFGGDGAIRNFQWKLTGDKSVPLTGDYGGTIILDKQFGSSIYDSENIEFTLTPTGPLIDGSTGQVIKMKHGQPSTNNYGKLVDIPIGYYTMTAVYQSSTGNIPIKLRDKEHNRTGAFASSIQLYFEPTTSYGYDMANVEYTEN
ncbi:carboxypeptidase regulatory-like domain-containing protein [Paraflavitalea soli]|uniref:Carboxypeptidase regulatory-like domain-containing protein n=1 Tax=Paraflavitalea soli TaxID=2315862 RepID=A0A3B7MGN3_9BACT|nr:carboxypeptidase-like regulatory domain-containing protein [Paraflavitalea soli]AXY73532.1 carboxypeptidase regulatory-like domain-containing protein [Paraflavitalea soli]